MPSTTEIVANLTQVQHLRDSFVEVSLARTHPLDTHFRTVVMAEERKLVAVRSWEKQQENSENNSLKIWMLQQIR